MYPNVPLGQPPVDRWYGRPVPAVDRCVQWAQLSLVAAGIALFAVWLGIGDDAPGIARPWALGAALVAGAVAVLGLVLLLTSAVQVVRQSGGSPRRPGRLRAAVLIVVAVAGTAVVGAAAGPEVATARDEQEAIDQKEAAARAATVERLAKERAEARAKAKEKAADPGSDAPRMLDSMGARMLHLPAGTCLTWSEGPSVADELDRHADGSTADEISCAEPHGYEVIGTAAVGGGDGYPGARVLIDAASGPCRELLLDYLTPEGGARPAATAWGAYGIAPSPDAWEDPAARRVTCVAMPPRWGTTRTGSLAGAG